MDPKRKNKENTGEAFEKKVASLFRDPVQDEGEERERQRGEEEEEH